MKILLSLFVFLFLAGCATAPKEDKGCGGVEVKKVQVQEKRVIVISEQDKTGLRDSIAVFTEQIEKKPLSPEAYYNRAKAYFFLKEYDKSWQDIEKSKSLGYVVEPGFLVKLQEASGTKQ
ncbi:MAG: hypothetical protein KJ880_02595 [Candidatus Omnitrophica bacterium]|nr:hypothetical protein [Candidatus Omnitrophota bacterium]MBU1869765.1 hypothetical protein [Candidatus Omnitrophota bacterium]